MIRKLTAALALITLAGCTQPGLSGGGSHGGDAASAYYYGGSVDEDSSMSLIVPQVQPTFVEFHPMQAPFQANQSFNCNSRALSGTVYTNCY